MKKYFALLVVFTFTAKAWSGELPTSDPGSLGFSADRLERVDSAVKQLINAGVFPGAVVAIMRKGEIVYKRSFGQRGVNDDRPMPEDGLFRMYSSSKSVTAVAMMQLYERGKIQLFDPISRYVPELSDLRVWKDGKPTGDTRPITIYQLLTHTSGLSYGIDASDPLDRTYLEAKLWHSEDLDDFADRVSKLPLLFEPGTQWRYSVGIDVAGLIVERVTGMTFDQYLKENIFEPLDMRDTGFVVSDADAHRLLPHHALGEKTVEISPDDFEVARVFPGGIFTFGCRALCDFRDVTLFSGGAGLVSTVRDYLRFGEMLRNGGELDGVRILSPITVRYMTSAHVRPPLVVAPGESFGLGIGVHSDPLSAAMIGNVGEFYHDGAGGTLLWVDPKEELVVLGMIQAMGGFIWKPALKVAVYQAITESYQ